MIHETAGGLPGDVSYFCDYATATKFLRMLVEGQTVIFYPRIDWFTSRSIDASSPARTIWQLIPPIKSR